MDLLDALRRLHESLRQRETLGMVGSVLVEEHHNPELLTLFRERLLLPRLEQFIRVLRRAEQEGAVRPGLDTATVGHLLVGAFMACRLDRGEVPDDLPHRVLDTIWPALAANTGTGTGTGADADTGTDAGTGTVADTGTGTAAGTRTGTDG